MDRALLVDALPASEQERGNAWAGRLFGLGSVIGFFACVLLGCSYSCDLTRIRINPALRIPPLYVNKLLEIDPFETEVMSI
jgi:hypothetical protein